MFQGSRLKKLREHKQLTQKELADILSVSESIVSFYETGRRVPGSEVVERIADYFKCSTDYLLGRTEILYPPKDMEASVNVEFIEVLSEWIEEGHTPEEFREIWEKVRDIAAKYK